MKIQSILPPLQAALLLLLASCTQEEFPDAPGNKTHQLAISVTDGGYTSTESKTTRTMENGYTTEFTEGDACGFYMTRGNEMIHSNVKLVAKKAPGTDDLVWEPEDGTALYGGLSDTQCYLYYPYQENMYGMTQTPEAYVSISERLFFLQLRDKWQPEEDQSTYASYTKSDLMFAKGTAVTAPDGTVQLSFVLTHQMTLVIIEMPKTIYKFTDAGVPDYVAQSEATFTGAAKPLRMADGTYRYLTSPTATPIVGSYDSGNKEFTITPPHFVHGNYYKYKVDGGVTIKNVTYAESGIARIGDFYCTRDNGTTGYLIPREADKATVQAATVVGIVFQTDKSRIGQAEKDALGGEDKAHGLVMSVKNASTSQKWNPDNKDAGLTKCETKADNYNDNSGYGNCEHIRALRGNFNNYPAFKAADEYNTTCPVPATTTGWYLPSSGQWWDIFLNLGGCLALADAAQQTSSDSIFLYWTGQGDIPAALNARMENIAADNKNNFKGNEWFWSSSEHAEGYARSWAMNADGLIVCYRNAKDCSFYVRPVLAF